MSEVLEIMAFMCLAAFAYFIWPPAALIPAFFYFIIASLAADGVDFKALLSRKRPQNEPD